MTGVRIRRGHLGTGTQGECRVRTKSCESQLVLNYQVRGDSLGHP